MTDKQSNAKSSSSILQERHIKVCKVFYNEKLKEETPYAAMTPVPWLQMRGRWLEQVGFAIDTQVKVTVKQGSIILTAQTAS